MLFDDILGHLLRIKRKVREVLCDYHEKSHYHLSKKQTNSSEPATMMVNDAKGNSIFIIKF